jgi:hypothetical protein
MNPDGGLLARTVTAAAALFAASAALVLAKTGRDALYFMGGGLPDLPGAYLAIAALSVPTSFGLVALAGRVGTRAARVGVALGTAAFLLLVARFATAGGGPFMTAAFVLVALLFGAVFSSAWLLAADLLEHAADAPRGRAYAAIGAASIAGGGAGALLARALAMHVDPRALLAVAAGALAFAALVMATAHRCRPRGAPVDGDPMPHPGQAKRALGGRYERMLLAIGMLAALAGILIEFRFYLAAATSGHSMRAGAHFFASSYFALNGAALVLQLVLAPGLRRAGARGGLLALPLCLLGGSAAAIFLRSPALPTVLRVAEGSLKSSVHRVSWEQAYLPLERGRRALTKAWVDGLGTHLAEGAGALLILFWLKGGGTMTRPSWADWLLVAVTLSWVLLTARLRPASAP